MEYDVLIIGGGISGIYSSVLLKEKKYKILLIEARKQLGGRIYSDTSLAHFPIELGAEFIHGKKSILTNYLKTTEEKMIKINENHDLYYNNKLQKKEEYIKDTYIYAAIRFFRRQWKYRGGDISVEKYLQKQDFYQTTKNILDFFGERYGTSNENLNMKSLAEEESLWHSGEKDYRTQSSFYDILQPLIKPIKKNIVLDQPITRIEYTEKNKIKVFSHEKSWTCRSLLLSVPISILKRGDIEFHPKLPPQKCKAIEQIGIDAVTKIIIKFEKKFWRKKFNGVIGGEICSNYYLPFDSNNSDEAIIICFFAGKKARNIDEMEEDEVIKNILKELSLIFRKKDIQKIYTHHKRISWAKIPHIYGGYSFSTLHSNIETRKELAKSINHQLFFCGEATNFQGHNSTIHGAMETAERAVEEITENLHL